MNIIVDGRAIAKEILKGVKESLGERRPAVRAIVMQPSAATDSYLRIKQAKASEAGMSLEVVRIADDGTTDDVIGAIGFPGADAIIVQLPLPERIDTDTVLSSIPPEKDADALSGNASVLSPVAGAVQEILMRCDVDVRAKRAVVVGQGRLVGAPVLALLRRLGADAISIDKYTSNPGSVLREADIIVSGAGDAHFITPDMVKEGVVLIDAGASELMGSVAGDVHPDCARKASVFTPVPGGIGPVAVAILFKNVADLQGGQ